MMKYTNIIKYADNANTLSGLFGSKTSYRVSQQADRNVLRAMIESDLSPEHLTCDGELSTKQVKQKYDYLQQCLKDLNELDALA